MTKRAVADIVAILREFLDSRDIQARSIDQLYSHHPIPSNELLSFRYQKHIWCVLFDESAHDNEEYIIKQVHTVHPEVSAHVMFNPKSDISTYGLPFKGKDVYLIEITPESIRLDQELVRRYPETSRASWQKHIKLGRVSVNGESVTSSKHQVKQTDDIGIMIPEHHTHDRMTLPIIYIDDDIVVVNKPAGILTHSKGAFDEEYTFASFMSKHAEQSHSTHSNRTGIVHRLDRDTSGVIVGVRNDDALHALQKQFANRTVRKTYLAVVVGTPTHQSAVIDIPIGRNPKAPSTFRADPKGKSAQTTYRTVASTESFALVELQPKTGRTHQLRVHMQHIGTPILGDRYYGKTSSDRLYLHAYSIELTTMSGERKRFTAPIPDEFATYFPGVHNLYE